MRKASGNPKQLNAIVKELVLCARVYRSESGPVLARAALVLP
jgi:hypothetical protein